MKSRQEWMRNHLIHQNNQYRFNYIKCIHINDDVINISDKISNLLKLNIIRDNSGTNENSDRTFFNLLRQKISNMGIVIMQSGIVGKNTHRTLKVKDFRAFALIDDIVPFIFINNSDSMRAKIFSLVHELIHILLGKNEILNASIEESNQIDSERWINNVTANVLIPEELVLNYINDVPRDEIRNIASVSHVSELAAAIRLKKLGIHGITEKLIDEIKRHEKKLLKINKENSKNSGGDYYNNVSSRVDTHFATAVINSEAEGDITLPRAASMLDVSLTHYDNAIKKL